MPSPSPSLSPASTETWIDRYLSTASSQRVQGGLVNSHARAERRSLELLLTYLTREQREDFEQDKAFDVKGSDGRCYRIHAISQENVYEWDRRHRRYKARLCAVPYGWMPVWDLMLAQMLWIQSDAKDFRETAMRMPLC